MRSVRQMRRDLEMLRLAAPKEHTPACDGWYRCTCNVGKAADAADRLAADLDELRKLAKA